MTIVIRDSRRHLLQDLTVSGRAMRVTFSSPLPRFVQHFVCVHGGHAAALAPSLSDATLLLRQCGRGEPVVLLGDLNVDLLPSLSADNSLSVGIPTLRGTPGGEFSMVDFSLAPCSRVATGEAAGKPSLLDHYASGNGDSGVSAFLSWDLELGDHAFLVVSAPACAHVLKARPRSTWHVGDRIKAQNWFSLHTPTSFSSIVEITDFFLSAQRENACQKKASQRRREREPESLKTLRSEIRSSTCNKLKKALKDKLFRARIHILSARRKIHQQKKICTARRLPRAKLFTRSTP